MLMEGCIDKHTVIKKNHNSFFPTLTEDDLVVERFNGRDVKEREFNVRITYPGPE